MENNEKTLDLDKLTVDKNLLGVDCLFEEGQEEERRRRLVGYPPYHFD